MLRLIAIGAAARALVLAGCGGDDGDDSGTTGASARTPSSITESPTAQAGKGTTIQVSDSDYGQILFDGDDQAIYLFDKEKGPNSECYDDCATAWPPVVTKGEPQAGKGADAGLLGTTQRDDGTAQITCAGHPLYHYEGDSPAQVLCQNVNEFGLWLVVQANGEPVRGSYSGSSSGSLARLHRPGGTRRATSPRPHSSSGWSDVITASTPASVSCWRQARAASSSSKSRTTSQSS